MLLFKWIRSFQHSQDHLSVSQRCLFHSSSSCLCFPALPPLLFSELDSLLSINFIRTEPLQSSLNYFNRWILFCLTFFTSFPVDSIQVFRVDHILSLGSSVLLAHSPLANLSFRSNQVISEDSSVFELIRGCHLIQIFQLFRCFIYLFIINFQRCFIFSGP